MTTNILLLFAAAGMVATAIVFKVIITDMININKSKNEVEKSEMPDVNDIPNWQPLNPIAKRSNLVLKKMYKGKAWNND
jgi:hypothetical protein